MIVVAMQKRVRMMLRLKKMNNEIKVDSYEL